MVGAQALFGTVTLILVRLLHCNKVLEFNYLLKLKLYQIRHFPFILAF